MSIFRDFRQAAGRSGTPVTVLLVVLIVFGFLASWFWAFGTLGALPFQTDYSLSRPWTFFTYPFCFGPGEILAVIFSCLWLWGVGGIVEREEGSARFAAIWLIASVLSALGIWFGSAILNQPTTLYSPWTPLAALTVIWGTRHPNDPVRFMFVLCITARWVAWISAALVVFGTQPPQMAPFAAISLLVAYLYAARKIPTFSPRRKSDSFVRGAGRYTTDYFEDVRRREKDREERERLRKLFEESSKDE
jgi:membrane associated rhomboid family serine protease